MLPRTRQVILRASGIPFAFPLPSAYLEVVSHVLPLQIVAG